MEAYLTPERETLLRLLEAANIEVVQNAPMCWEMKNNYAGFALSYPATQRIRVIICTNAIMEVAKGMRFVSELNRTIDHEALHAAQFARMIILLVLFRMTGLQTMKQKHWHMRVDRKRSVINLLNFLFLIMSDFIWVEKYRPQTIQECILPEETKKMFQDFLNKGEIPNMLLAGPPGIGKTTVAKALCNQLGVDYYVINGSDEGRFLDTVRNNAKNFASTVSLQATAKHKVIIIDEADNTSNDVQLCLRAFIEEFAKNCRFIFTCNYKNKILEPLHSRCTVVEFGIKGKERATIANGFFARLREILEGEGLNTNQKYLLNLSASTSPTGDESLMSVSDTPWW